MQENSVFIDVNNVFLNRMFLIKPSNSTREELDIMLQNEIDSYIASTMPEKEKPQPVVEEKKVYHIFRRM